MTRLDDYRAALCVGFPDVSDAGLADILAKSGSDFARFIVDHGLGPLWHERTGSAEFQESRRVAEALYGAQEHALREVAAVLSDFASFETPKRIAILAESFTIDNGFLPPSLKVRRRVIQEHFKDVIDGLYEDEAAHGVG